MVSLKLALAGVYFSFHWLGFSGSLVSVWSFIFWVSSGLVVLSSELFSGSGFLLLGFVVMVYSGLAIIKSFALDQASL